LSDTSKVLFELVTDSRARQLRSADMRMLTVHRTSSCFRDKFCSCCHKSSEQFAVRLMKSRLVVLSVQAVAEDSPTTAHCELY